MFEKKLDLLLSRKGYQRMMLNTQQIRLYARTENGECHALIYYPFEGIKGLAREGQENIVKQVRQYFYDAGYMRLMILSLVETKDASRGRTLFGAYENVWFLDVGTGRVILYEGQEDFDGLRRELEDQISSAVGISHEGKQDGENKKFAISLCNTFLIATNITVFLLCEIFGSTLDTKFLLEHGALNYQRVFFMGEYYRLFTYMFLHGGIDHLFNNMLILWFLGDNLEKQMGHVKYLILYFASGILAGFVSMSYNGSVNGFVISVGASGAIFGVSGALAFIVLVNRGRVENLSIRQMILFIALSLYGGFQSQGVDNVAHVGGLVAGILLGLLLYRKKKPGVDSRRKRGWIED